MIKVAAEVAAAEFDRMCEANRIETDTSELTEEQVEEWDGLRKQVERDIRRGLLAVDKEGQAVYTPPEGKALTFKIARGAVLIALETHGKGKDISNTLAALGELTGEPPSAFSKLHVRDVQACTRLVRLFLADQ